MSDSEWKPLNGIEAIGAAVAAGMDIQIGVSAIGVTSWIHWDGSAWHKTNKYRARPRKPEPVQIFDVDLDAARYRWLRENRDTLLLVTFFGNGCINHTISEVDDAIDAAIGNARKPAKKVVKSLCWRDSTDGELLWRDEGLVLAGNAQRFPAGDLEGGVEV